MRGSMLGLGFRVRTRMSVLCLVTAGGVVGRTRRGGAFFVMVMTAFGGRFDVLWRVTGCRLGGSRLGTRLEGLLDLGK